MAEINFHNFQNKKENKGLDLNINNENEFDEDKHMNMNLNLMNEFHFSEDNHYDNDIELNIHEQNANSAVAERRLHSFHGTEPSFFAVIRSFGLR